MWATDGFSKVPLPLVGVHGGDGVLLSGWEGLLFRLFRAHGQSLAELHSPALVLGLPGPTACAEDFAEKSMSCVARGSTAAISRTLPEEEEEGTTQQTRHREKRERRRNKKRERER